MLGFLFGKGKSKNISISSDGGISVISDSSNGRVNIEGKNNLSNNSISIGRNCSVNGTVFYSNSDEEININNDDGDKFDLEFNGKKYSDCVNVKIIIDGIEHNEKISRKNYAKAFGGLPIKIDVKGTAITSLVLLVVTKTLAVIPTLTVSKGSTILALTG